MSYRTEVKRIAKKVRKGDDLYALASDSEFVTDPGWVRAQRIACDAAMERVAVSRAMRGREPSCVGASMCFHWLGVT